MGRELALEAFDGTAIPNSIDADPSREFVELARLGTSMQRSAAQQLSEPTGRYNCHGLVFASRRTNIPPPGMPGYSIDELLRADGYVRATPPVSVGDVVVYRGDTGVEHTGVVCRVDFLVVGGNPVPIIWSMWGGLGEFVHAEGNTPYGERVEYWRIKRK